MGVVCIRGRRPLESKETELQEQGTAGGSGTNMAFREGQEAGESLAGVRPSGN